MYTFELATGFNTKTIYHATMYAAKIPIEISSLLLARCLFVMLPQMPPSCMCDYYPVYSLGVLAFCHHNCHQKNACIPSSACSIDGA